MQLAQDRQSGIAQCEVAACCELQAVFIADSQCFPQCRHSSLGCRNVRRMCASSLFAAALML